MYFLYVLASFYLLLKYSRQPLHNGASNWQWNVLILAKLFEVKNDIPIMNDIFTAICITYVNFVIVLYVISPLLSDDFIGNTKDHIEMINAAMILSML